jgi:1,4-alpha-glucan branching enzyme
MEPHDDHGPPGSRAVTFRTPPHPDAESANYVGDYNDWSPTATPMVRVGEHFEITLVLEEGRTHRYRFLIDDERWENDWYADAYEPNPFGGDDSVCDLTAAGGSAER